MKVPLAFKLIIIYTNIKLKLVGIVSPKHAAAMAFKRFCTPYSGKPKRIEPQIFNTGEKLEFKFENLTIHGWKWQPQSSNNRKILIVHGFDSCSYKFDNYIQPLTSLGFEVFAFDAPGHGISDGHTINGLQYCNFILDIEKLFGSFYCIMAHSLGALAAALALEQMNNQAERKLVLIAPATETTSAVKNYFRFVHVSQKVKQAFNELMFNIGNKPVSWYSVARAVNNIATPILWVHDEEDFVCAFGDTLPVQQANHGHIEFYFTKGLGHSGVYRRQQVFDKIIEFIKG